MQMADILDKAQELEELHRYAALAAARKASLPPSPICRNCDEPLEAGRINFCDTGCRNDWEKRRRYQQHHGYDDS